MSSVTIQRCYRVIDYIPHFVHFLWLIYFVTKLYPLISLIYNTHLLFPFICWWVLRLPLYLDCYKKCCSEDRNAYIFLNSCFHFLWKISRNGITVCHMGVLFLIFWRNSVLFSIVAAPVYMLTSRAQGFPLLHILINMCYLLPFW